MGSGQDRRSIPEYLVTDYNSKSPPKEHGALRTKSGAQAAVRLGTRFEAAAAGPLVTSIRATSSCSKKLFWFRVTGETTLTDSLTVRRITGGGITVYVKSHKGEGCP